MLSKNQVDKVGEELRRGEFGANALVKLSQYQQEFNFAYSHVERILTEKLYLSITGRPQKSTLSIIEKLRRIKSRLTQIQDISGCRTIVPSLIEQDEVVKRAKEWFQDVYVDDKREVPTHGYRAVHLIVNHHGKCVEVQVRTRIQHFWATVSEKTSDIHGQEIKYGNGDAVVIKNLLDLSEAVRKFDSSVAVLRQKREQYSKLLDARNHDKAKLKEVSKDIKAKESLLRYAMYDTRKVLMRFDEG